MNLTRYRELFGKLKGSEEFFLVVGAVVLASASILFWSAYGLRTKWMLFEYIWNIILFVPAVSLVWFCVKWFDVFEKEQQKRMDQGDPMDQGKEIVPMGAVFILAFVAGMIAFGAWSIMFQLNLCLPDHAGLLLVATILVPWATTIGAVNGLNRLIKRMGRSKPNDDGAGLCSDGGGGY